MFLFKSIKEKKMNKETTDEINCIAGAINEKIAVLAKILNFSKDFMFKSGKITCYKKEKVEMPYTINGENLSSRENDLINLQNQLMFYISQLIKESGKKIFSDSNVLLNRTSNNDNNLFVIKVLLYFSGDSYVSTKIDESNHGENIMKPTYNYNKQIYEKYDQTNQDGSPCSCFLCCALMFFLLLIVLFFSIKYLNQ